MERGTVILTCVAGYFVLCIVIGLWALRRTRSARDFFVAGRHLGMVVTGVAIFSSVMSGFGFVGGPGLVYLMGMSSVWMVLCGGISYSLSSFLLGKRLRLLGEYCDSVSLPDLVAVRYNSEICRLLTAVAILLGVVGYLAAQIQAMARVLVDLLVAHTPFEGFSFAAAIAISTTVLVFYCVTGGIVASVYTDLVQGLIMVVVAVLVFITAVGSFDGGWTEAMQTHRKRQSRGGASLGNAWHCRELCVALYVHDRWGWTASRRDQIHDVQESLGLEVDLAFFVCRLRVDSSALGGDRISNACPRRCWRFAAVGKTGSGCFGVSRRVRTSAFGRARLCRTLCRHHVNVRCIPKHWSRRGCP